MEPPTRSNQLLSLSNVIITPHMAWYSTSSTAEIQEKAAENVARALSGQIPINLLNKEVLEKRGSLTR
jgi:phosphoglycerate dehydrogenase-like enzyme